MFYRLNVSYVLPLLHQVLDHRWYLYQFLVFTTHGVSLLDQWFPFAQSSHSMEQPFDHQAAAVPGTILGMGKVTVASDDDQSDDGDKSAVGSKAKELFRNPHRKRYVNLISDDVLKW